MLIIVSILSGMFKDIILYTYLIFIHECGHFLMGSIFKWKKDKIYFYIYGGCTKFNVDINVNSLEELIVLVMGPIFQLLGTIVLGCFLNIKDNSLLYNYSYTLLIFNLLPIYPLDGGRLLNIVLNKFLSFKKSFIFSILLSVLIVIIFIYLSIKYYLRINIILMFIFLLSKVIEEYKKRNYYFNKFLLERFIKDYHFTKTIYIKDINNMKKEKKHILYKDNKYYTEREFLKKIFKKS